MHYRTLAHVALRCKNYDTMYNFYVNQLGGKEIFHLNYDCRPGFEGNENIWLTYVCFGKGQYIELFTDSYESDNTFATTSFANLCFEVGNMTLELKALEAQGIAIYESPNGALIRPPFAQHGPDECGVLTAYICDPEGNWIELQQFRPESMQMVCS